VRQFRQIRAPDRAEVVRQRRLPLARQALWRPERGGAGEAELLLVLVSGEAMHDDVPGQAAVEAPANMTLHPRAIVVVDEYPARWECRIVLRLGLWDGALAPVVLAQAGKALGAILVRRWRTGPTRATRPLSKLLIVVCGTFDRSLNCSCVQPRASRSSRKHWPKRFICPLLTPISPLLARVAKLASKSY